MDIVDQHMRGHALSASASTPSDGLLAQGAEGYQLTWMDAKVGDWVVTPRRGKAVEINALWYNALRLSSAGSKKSAARGGAGPTPSTQSARAPRSTSASGTRRAATSTTSSTAESTETTPRSGPNQLFAVSLPHPVLDAARWARGGRRGRGRRLRHAGGPALARAGTPDYKPKYYGDLRARDAAYHQGTVWAWLIGPFVDAWLKVGTGDRATARQLLHRLRGPPDEAGVGSISEIFDAEPPFTPRGCIAQAWSVAEVLRCLVKTAE